MMADEQILTNADDDIRRHGHHGETTAVNCHLVAANSLQPNHDDGAQKINQTKRQHYHQCCSNHLACRHSNALADTNEPVPPTNHGHVLTNHSNHLTDGTLANLLHLNAVQCNDSANSPPDPTKPDDDSVNLIECDTKIDQNGANDNVNARNYDATLQTTTTTTMAATTTAVDQLQQRHSLSKRGSTGSRSAAGKSTKQRTIIRKFQKLDAAALSATPAPDVKIGQRVAYKEYYGNEFGTIRWIGRVPQISPDWTAGVEFDNAIGEGDGSLNGRRYFIAKDCFAKFLPLDSVAFVDQHVGRPEPGTMISVMSASVRPGQMISIQRVSTVHVQHCFLNAPHRPTGADILAVNSRLHCQCPNCGPCAHVVKPPRTQRLRTGKNATHMCQFSTYTCCGMESSDEALCTYTGNKISSLPPPDYRSSVGLPPVGNSWIEGSGYLSQLQAQQSKLMPDEYRLGAGPHDYAAGPATNRSSRRGSRGLQHQLHQQPNRLSTKPHQDLQETSHRSNASSSPIYSNIQPAATCCPDCSWPTSGVFDGNAKSFPNPTKQAPDEQNGDDQMRDNGRRPEEEAPPTAIQTGKPSKVHRRDSIENRYLFPTDDDDDDQDDNRNEHQEEPIDSTLEADLENLSQARYGYGYGHCPSQAGHQGGAVLRLNGSRNLLRGLRALVSCLSAKSNHSEELERRSENTLRFFGQPSANGADNKSQPVLEGPAGLSSPSMSSSSLSSRPSSRLDCSKSATEVDWSFNKAHELQPSKRRHHNHHHRRHHHQRPGHPYPAPYPCAYPAYEQRAPPYTDDNGDSSNGPPMCQQSPLSSSSANFMQHSQGGHSFKGEKIRSIGDSSSDGGCSLWGAHRGVAGVVPAALASGASASAVASAADVAPTTTATATTTTTLQQMRRQISSSSDCGFSSASQNSINFLSSSFPSCSPIITNQQQQQQQQQYDDEQRRINQIYKRIVAKLISSSSSSNNNNVTDQDLFKLKRALLEMHSNSSGGCCLHQSTNLHFTSDQCDQIIADIIKKSYLNMETASPGGGGGPTEVQCRLGAASANSPSGPCRCCCPTSNSCSNNGGPDTQQPQPQPQPQPPADQAKGEALQPDNRQPRRLDDSGEQLNVANSPETNKSGPAAASLPRAFELKLTLSINSEQSRVPADQQQTAQQIPREAGLNINITSSNDEPLLVNSDTGPSQRVAASDGDPVEPHEFHEPAPANELVQLAN